MNWSRIIFLIFVMLVSGLLLERAAWAESNGVLIPEVFGVKLGDDIQNYPGMREEKTYDDGTVNYTRAEDDGKTFEGVGTLTISYSTYEGRVAGVIFTFKSDDLDSIMKDISARYGDYRQIEKNLLWDGDYFSISIEPYGDNRIAYFVYTPLEDKMYSNIFGIHKLSCNDVYLNEHISNYKMMIPYIYFKPEEKYTPGTMDYYRLFDKNEFGKHTVTMYRTYKGIIFTITVYFEKNKLNSILKILHKRYAGIEKMVFRRLENIWSWHFGEYIIRVYYRPEEDYSIIEFAYQPLLTQAKIAEREHLGE